MNTAPSLRDQLWNACPDKSCCRTTRVHVTGADLTRLVSALELPPTSVVTAVPLRPPDDGHGFRLRRGGPALELVLRKNGPIGAAGAPCVFLVQTNDGHALCGAGDVRPTSCRAYPAIARDVGVGVLGDPCPCHVWVANDIGESERSAALAAAAEQADDRQVIHAWNVHVQSSVRRFSVEEFCTHLLQHQRSGI